MFINAQVVVSPVAKISATAVEASPRIFNWKFAAAEEVLNNIDVSNKLKAIVPLADAVLTNVCSLKLLLNST